MSITTQDALTRIIEHREIFHDEMLDLMRRIMSGEMSLSSTVGSEAWNSRDLKSRPH